MNKRKADYKKFKIQLIITAICMVAVLSVMIVGISAGRVERLRISSIVNIPARSVSVDINCVVSGHTNIDEVNATYNKTVTEADEEVPSWNIGDMQFDESGNVPIIITILIRNNDTRDLDLAFLIPPDNDKVKMEYLTGASLIPDDIELTEKKYQEGEGEKVESTEDFRLLDELSIATNEYYKIQIKMSVVDIKQDFNKIPRNFAVTMAVKK